MRAELMPAVSARFPTDGRDALVGESLAGLFVAATLVDAPELFKACNLVRHASPTPPPRR